MPASWLISQHLLPPTSAILTAHKTNPTLHITYFRVLSRNWRQSLLQIRGVISWLFPVPPLSRSFSG